MPRQKGSNRSLRSKRLGRSKCIAGAVGLFFVLVFFFDYFEELKILQSTSDNETQELRDSNNIQKLHDFHTLESSEPDKDENEKVDDAELLGAIEEVIENIEHQVETNVDDGDENEKVDDEELLEAIEEVIENIEHQVETNSEEVSDEADGEKLLEAIEEVIENIEHQVESKSEPKTNVGENELLHKVLSAKSKLEARIRKDYGEWFDALFSKNSLKETVEISDISTERLIALFQSKILSAQLTDEKTTFVWTTGGHSAAAGHGNLFSQSYTAILEDTARDVFASLDIEFIGRNHAMGGYSSGPELACCMTSIYGKDTDILSWDFGMTDGSRNPQHMILWSHRAALLRGEGLPFLFYMKHPDKEVINLETKGLGIGWRNAIDVTKLPDFETLDPSVIISIPKPVQYFRCGDHYETQSTICAENKWNTSVCNSSVKYQASWHPGWRAHMLNGRILGFFIIDILVQAVERIISSDSQISTSEIPPGITQEYFEHVVKKEKSIKDEFLVGPVPEEKFSVDFKDHDVPNKILYHSESICHSGLLPNMARYNLDALQDEAYPLLMLPPFPDSGTRPAYLAYDSLKVQECNTTLNIDYKDYYLTRHGDGLTTITVPSGMELGSSEDLYLPDLNGLILICQPRCDWGQCKEGSIQLHTQNSTSTDVEIRVNGDKVFATQRIENFCYFLEKSSGNLNWGEGKQYDISFRVNEPDSLLEISSMIVF